MALLLFSRNLKKFKSFFASTVIVAEQWSTSMYAWVGVYWCGAHSKIRSVGNHPCLAISVPWGVWFSPSKSVCANDVQRLSQNRTHGAGQCRFVGLRIPRMCVGIHRLFLCKFSLRWGAPPHSLVPALPDLFSGGYGFFRRKAFEQPRTASFAEPNPRPGPMSLRGPTNPAKVRGHSLAFPL